MAELSMRRSGVYAARGDFGFGDFQGPTGSMTPVGGGGGNLSQILGAASSLLGPLVNRFTQPSAPPTGFGGILGPYLNRNFPTASSMLEAITPGSAGNGGALFSSGMPTTVRPLRRVPVSGPDGRLYWFGYLGKPVLFSGDLAAARRVSRVARRAARYSRRRTFRRGRR